MELILDFIGWWVMNNINVMIVLLSKMVGFCSWFSGEDDMNDV